MPDVDEKGNGPFARVLQDFCKARSLPDPQYMYLKVSGGFGATVNYTLGIALSHETQESEKHAKEKVAEKALISLRVDTSFIGAEENEEDENVEEEIINEKEVTHVQKASSSKEVNKEDSKTVRRGVAIAQPTKLVKQPLQLAEVFELEPKVKVVPPPISGTFIYTGKVYEV